MKEYPDMTNPLLAEKIEWSVSRVKYYIQKLKQFEKIRRKGTSRDGRWEVPQEGKKALKIDLLVKIKKKE